MKSYLILNIFNTLINIVKDVLTLFQNLKFRKDEKKYNRKTRKEISNDVDNGKIDEINNQYNH